MLHCVAGCVGPGVSNDSGTTEICGLGGDLGILRNVGNPSHPRRLKSRAALVVAVNRPCVVKYGILKSNIYRRNAVFFVLRRNTKRTAALVAGKAQLTRII